jgi:hypothetical protein
MERTVVHLERPSLWNRVCQLFGFAVLTPFERTLFGAVQGQLSDDARRILEHQMRRANHIVRAYPLDERFKYCRVGIWHKKRRASVAESEPRFSSKGVMVLGTVTVEHEGGAIEGIVETVDGVISALKIRSEQRIWYPISDYTIVNVRVAPGYDRGG